jgi:hypothetical protein
VAPPREIEDAERRGLMGSATAAGPSRAQRILDAWQAFPMQFPERTGRETMPEGNGRPG